MNFLKQLDKCSTADESKFNEFSNKKRHMIATKPTIKNYALDLEFQVRILSAYLFCSVSIRSQYQIPIHCTMKSNVSNLNFSKWH